MFGIRYRKSSPAEYVLHYERGRLAREGAGLSFFYFAPASTMVSVPLGSENIPFAFQEPTADFQVVTVQGQLTYRVAEPKKCASMLNFTIDARGRYVSDDYQKLPERLIHGLQTLIRTRLQAQPLREALASGDALAGGVLPQLMESPEVKLLGVEILNLAILSLQPAPDMAKALEAETREALNRRMDEAIYARRNAAVEQERRIKDNELETELMVQRKKRELYEREMQGEIALEKQRAHLTAQKVENQRHEADARAYALEAVLKPVQGLDWRVLMMLNPQSGDARNSIAMAFQELAANAQKIGEVNVSPDLLRSLIGESRR